MKLVIGGRAQGKLALTLAAGGLSPEDVCDGADCPLDQIPRAPVVNRLHLLVRRLLDAGENPAAFVERIARENPEVIFIADEVGCGVVPADPDERAWREAAGRVCCALARESARVERVYAGIATAIKGG